MEYKIEELTARCASTTALRKIPVISAVMVANRIADLEANEHEEKGTNYE